VNLSAEGMKRESKYRILVFTRITGAIVHDVNDMDFISYEVGAY